ncbi:hypothetical protein HY570_04180 [Candidatus Micrarchaeota archaeon]|nr:hypothetical protein [Candidatus Micrarchaeota archaeon]
MLGKGTLFTFFVGLVLFGCIYSQPAPGEGSNVVPSIDVYAKPVPGQATNPVDILPQSIAGSKLTSKEELDYGEVGQGVTGYYDEGKVRITIIKYKVHDDASADVENLDQSITESYRYLQNGSVSTFPNNVTVVVKIGEKKEDYKFPNGQVLTQTWNESKIYYLSTDKAWMEWTSHFDSGFAWTKDNWSFLVYLKAPNTALRNEIVSEFPY